MHQRAAKELLNNSIYPTEDELRQAAEVYMKSHHLEFINQMSKKD